MKPSILLLLLLTSAVRGGEVMVQLATGAGGAQYGEGYLYPPGWSMGPMRYLAERSPYAALLADGSALVWSDGMGLGTTIPTPAISNGQQMVFDNRCVLVRRGDGSVVGWGDAFYAGSILPVPALPRPAVDLTMGYRWAAALLDDGSVFAWGEPPTIPGDARFTDITSTSYALIGLRADGAVRAHGSSGATVNMPAEVQADGAGVRMISGYTNYAAALTADGRILAWGPGPLSKSWTGPFDQVSIGADSVLARRTNGKVMTLDFYGMPDQEITAAAGADQLRASGSGAISCRLPNGTLLQTYSSVPPNGPPVGLDLLRSVTTGMSTCVGVHSDGRVTVWGRERGRYAAIPWTDIVQGQPSQNNQRVYLLRSGGSLLCGTLGSFSEALGGIRAFDTYGDFAVCLRNDGTVAITGYSIGQVGAVPAGLSGVIAVAAGNDFAVALKADGTVVPWGAGTGQAVPPADLGDVIQVDCGYDHVLALRRDGTVRSWGGGNSQGQRNVPVGLAGVVQVAADENTSYALKADGTVVQWGQQLCTPASLAAITNAGQIHSHNILLANRNVRPVFLAPPRTTSAGHVLLNVSWNWPVTGFAANDVAVGNGTINAVSGSGTSWQLDVSPTGPGVVTVAIAAAAVSSEPGWVSLPASASFIALALDSSNASASTAEQTATVVTLPNPNPVAVTYQVVTTPAYGSVSAFAGNQVTYTPEAGFSGTDTFTYRVGNGAYWSAAATVTVTVRQVNQAPTLGVLSDRIMFEDGAPLVVALAGIGPGRASEAGQTLSITTSSSHPDIVPSPAVTYTSPSTAGSLTITPSPNAFGSADITVTVRDNGGTTDGGIDEFQRTFRIDVSPVNDPPTLAFVPSITVEEDAAEQTLVMTAISPGPANEGMQTLTIQAFSTAPALVGHPSVDYTGGSIATMRWRPQPDANGTVRIFVSIVDDGGTADGGIDSVSQSFTITVLPVNDPPSAVIAPWQVNPSAAYAVPPANLRLLDVDEPPAHELVATLVSPPAAGHLKLGPGGDPLGVGSQFTMQDILDGRLAYVAPATLGTVHVIFTVSDGLLATGPYDLAITIDTVINELPDLWFSGDVAVWQEGQPPVSVDPNALVSDPDTAVFNGGEVAAAVTVNATAADRLVLSEVGGVTVDAGAVAVSGVVVGTLSGGSSGAPLVVALNNQATVVRVERVVRAVAFAVDSTTPDAALRTVQVQVRDGVSAGAATQIAQVAVVPVNSPPVVAFPRVATAINEREAPATLDDGAICIDEDSPSFANGRVTIAFTSGVGPDDRLALANIGPITVVGGSVAHGGTAIGTLSGGGVEPLVVELVAAATPARVQDLLRALTIANVGMDPVPGTRVVRATVEDGEGGTGQAEIGVYVAAVNDPPEVTVSAGAVRWRQGEPASVIDQAATVADVDSHDFAGGRMIAMISVGAATGDRLELVTAGPIAVANGTVTWLGLPIGSVTGGESGVPLTVTFTADATPSRVQDVLRALAFRCTAAVPTTQDRTVTLTVEDGDGGASAPRSRVVELELVNLPPTVVLGAGQAAWIEDGQPVVVAPDATVVDDDSSQFIGGRLTVMVTGADADDRLTIANQGVANGEIGLSGTTVTWGGTDIGTWSGGNGAMPLVVDLLPTATPLRVQALLRAVLWRTLSQDPPAIRTIGAVLNDGSGGTSNLAERSVAITAVNDAPTGAASVLTIAGLTASGRWTAADPEGDAVTWSILAQPGNGTLVITDVATGAWSFVPGPDAGVATATVRVTDVHGAASAPITVPVVISAAGDPGPAPASDPPLSVPVGGTWTWDMVVAAGDIAAVPSLEVEAIGGPDGLVATVDGGHRVVLVWPVPAGDPAYPAGKNVRFHLRLSDRSSGRSAVVPVLIHLRAALGAGG